MPFVVPQQQQQPQQTVSAQPQPMPRGGMNLQSMSPMQARIGMQGGGQPMPRYGGGGPLSISNPMQRQPQFYGKGGDPRQMQMQQQMQQQMMRNPYQQMGGAGGRPMPWGYESYNKAGSPGMHQENMMHAGGPGGFDENTGQQRMPPAGNPAALGLIASNGAPAGGVYSSGFAQEAAPITFPTSNPYARTTGRGGGVRY